MFSFLGLFSKILILKILIKHTSGRYHEQKKVLKQTKIIKPISKNKSKFLPSTLFMEMDFCLFY